MRMHEAKRAMREGTLKVNRSSIRICADPARVIARHFVPGNDSRIRTIVNRVLDLPETEVFRLFTQVFNDYDSRHKNIKEIFIRHFDHRACGK